MVVLKVGSKIHKIQIKDGLHFILTILLLWKDQKKIWMMEMEILIHMVSEPCKIITKIILINLIQINNIIYFLMNSIQRILVKGATWFFEAFLWLLVSCLLQGIILRKLNFFYKLIMEILIKNKVLLGFCHWLVHYLQYYT